MLRWVCLELASFFKDMIIRLIIIGMYLLRSEFISRVFVISVDEKHLTLRFPYAPERSDH